MPQKQRTSSSSSPTPTAAGKAAGSVERQPRGNAAAQERLKAKKGPSNTPYTDTYGGAASQGAAFQVDAGQLTFDAEGTEGGRFHSRKAHVPPGPSGVTIGRGYDLGQHTRAQIIAALTAVGMSKSAAAAYAKSAGLKGDDARRWLGRNRGSLEEISATQQESLFSTTYDEMAKDVDRISKKRDVVGKFGAADLDEMNPVIKDTLVDLRYRGDYTGGARTKIQGAAASDDIMAMTDSLSDRSQWKGVPQDRFERRAKYLKEEEASLEMDAYATGNGPREHGVHYPSYAELMKENAAKKAATKGKAVKSGG